MEFPGSTLLSGESGYSVGRVARYGHVLRRRPCTVRFASLPLCSAAR